MNRIRKYKNKYQVLIAPHQKYNTGFEYLLGSWTDEGLMGFVVESYDTYYDAEYRASDHPDINWDQLVAYHKDIHDFFRKEITDIIEHSEIPVRFQSHLMTSEETKQIMFDRIIKGQTMTIDGDEQSSQFRLIYDMNDIVSFIITNPWSKNLKEMSNRLIQHSRLNIFNIIQKNNIIHLIGKTDIGTTYEIVLIPDTIYNWIQWKKINRNLSEHTFASTLKNILKSQQIIDRNPVLR